MKAYSTYLGSSKKFTASVLRNIVSDKLVK